MVSNDATESRHSHFRPDIQGLRAVAVLLVVLFHSRIGLPGGFIGVDVFFVISGFVITELLLRELSSTGRVSLARFYARRARRILPAAGLVILVTLVLIVLLTSPLTSAHENAGKAGAASSLFVSNFWFMGNTGGYFDARAESNPFLQMWSLSVEEQFYLVFPIALVLLWSISRGTRNVALTVLVAAFAMVSLCAGVVWSSRAAQPFVLDVGPLQLRTTDALVAFFGPLSRAWEFLAGALVSLCLAKRVLPRRFRAFASWVGIALILCGAVVISETDSFPGTFALVPVMGTVLILCAGKGETPPSAWPTRALSMRGPVGLGDVSYSWYLWHWPLLVLAFTWFSPEGLNGLWVSVGAFVPALLSYRYLESPIRRGRFLGSGRGIVVIVFVFVAFPFLASSSVASASAQGWGNSSIKNVRSQIKAKTIVLPPERCTNLRVSVPDDGSLPPCIWRTSLPRKGTILVIGDSHAAQYISAIAEVGGSLGYDVQLAWGGSCALTHAQTQTPVCNELAADASRELARSKFSTVVVSHASVNQAFAMARKASDSQGLQPDRAFAMWSQGLADVVRRSDSSQEFLFLGDNPGIGGIPDAKQVPECLKPGLLLRPTADCGYATERGAQLRFQAAEAERSELDQFPNVSYLDLGAQFCSSSDRCQLVRDGIPLVMDGSHLTLDAVQSLRSSLRPALERTLAS